MTYIPVSKIGRFLNLISKFSKFLNLVFFVSKTWFIGKNSYCNEILFLRSFYLLSGMICQDGLDLCHLIYAKKPKTNHYVQTRGSINTPTLCQGCHSNLRSQIPDIPDIILTFWTKNCPHFQCRLERERTDFIKHKTNKNQNSFKMLKEYINSKLHVYLA